MDSEALRYTAFSDTPDGGNPAGVVLDATGMDDGSMQAVAAEIGYSETAFVFPQGDGPLRVRYFSPRAEVPFCGHATIATAVALAEHQNASELVFETAAGRIPIELSRGDGLVAATLTSVATHVREADPADVDEVLATLRWERDELDPGLPPRVGYAGAHHLILAAATRERLAAVDYDFDRLDALMAARDWTTVDLVWSQDPGTFYARNLFPPGGVVEDPATGAAAAAFGAYLRALGRVEPPARVVVHQGDDYGRPSELLVDVPAGDDTGIRVTGTAVRIEP